MFTATDVILCMGRRGCGKSHLAKVVQAVFPRVVRFDTTGEYPPDEASDCWDFHEFGEKMLAHQHADSFALTYRFDPERSRSKVEEFSEAMRVCYYRGSVLVVIEEIQNFATAHSMPHWLEHSLTTGRHRQLALLFTTQMPRFTHKAIISQSNHVFCGTLHEKNDMAYAGTIFGEKTTDLPSLPERRFLYFRLGHGIMEVDNSLGTPASALG